MTQNTNQFGFRTILRGFLNAFNLEKGIIPTLRDLLLRPGKVISYYIEGKEKYFSPGRFFVTAFALYAIFIFLSPSIMPAMESLDDDGYPTNLKQLDKTFEWLEGNPMIYYGLFLIPSAIITRLSFYKHKLNLAKHFVIHIYCMCFLVIIWGLMMMPFDLFFQEEMNKLIVDEVSPSGRPIQLQTKIALYTVVSFFAQITYYAFAFKQIFQIKTYHAILKSFLLLFGIIISTASAGIVFTIVASKLF